MPPSSVRVLLAEDDAVLRNLVAALLREEGYAVLEAGTGVAALECARTDQPDVLLLDLDLPWLNGIEVLEQLRSNPATAAIATVVVSGCVDPTVEALIQQPAWRVADIVEKPVDLGRLLADLETAAPQSVSVAAT
jgi:CheY-like chemotaxis protein